LADHDVVRARLDRELRILQASRATRWFLVIQGDIHRIGGGWRRRFGDADALAFFRSRSLEQWQQELRAIRGVSWELADRILLFIAEALKLHDNAAWPAKVVFLVLAILVQSTMYQSVIKPGKAESSPWLAKLTATLSMLFWFGTGFAGRAIGFFLSSVGN
jgi:hypothetical protein